MDMAAHPDASTLAEWGAPIDDIVAYADRVIRHPRFEPAVQTLGDNMLALAAADRALDGVFKDAGRYVAAMMAVYLDTVGGVTLPALKAICERSGFLSPGRARALLAYMLYLGYLELLPVTRRGVPARYRLTARFVDSWRLHQIWALRAAQEIEPGVALVIAGFARPEVLAAYVRLQGETVFEASRDMHVSSAFMQVFLHRHAGMQLVHTLVTSAPWSEAFPGDQPEFSLAATARRLGVSRTHIRRVLVEAEARDLLTIDPQGVVRVLASGRTQIAYHYAVQLGRMLTCAARTLSAHPDIAARA